MGPKCKSCQRRGTTPDIHGWYNLTVNVPESPAKRKYIWLGVFCSLACLARALPDMRLQELQTEDLYEHTPAVRDNPPIRANNPRLLG